jgi:hypothetical protein
MVLKSHSRFLVKEMWQAIQYVTSAATLCAFIVAVIAWVIKKQGESQRKRIELAPESERSELISKSLEFFDADIAGLSRQQQYDIVMKQIAARIERFRIIASVVVILAILGAGLSLLSIKQVSAQNTTENSQDRAKNKFVLHGYIYSTKQPQGIENATLTLELPQGPTSTTSTTTVSNGIFKFDPVSDVSGKLTITANGYETKTLYPDPSNPDRSMPIELESSDGSQSVASPKQTNANIARAEAAAGWWLETGQIGSAPNYQDALTMYLKAVADGDVIANWNIGRLYEFGRVGPPDLEKAKYWYQKAIDRGDGRSMEYLKNVGHNPIQP